ncbi:MAG: hypothetical protein CMJ34_14385 [Phycisphaerae bacterium]|nr:hypothetical protein [Phycisphaerae bacterium]
MGSMVPEDDISQVDADRICTAASAVFFALLKVEATRTHTTVVLPELLCPKARLPSPSELDPHVIEEATAMLLRLGVVETDERGDLRLHLVRRT